MYQFSCFILNFVFLTVSAAVFACASTVSSGPVGQASIDDVERFFLRYLCGIGRFEPAAAGTCSLCLAGGVVVACKFHWEASLPQDLFAAQLVWALFIMAQLGGRLETPTGLGPTNPTAS